MKGEQVIALKRFLVVLVLRNPNNCFHPDCTEFIMEFCVYNFHDKVEWKIFCNSIYNFYLLYLSTSNNFCWQGRYKIAGQNRLFHWLPCWASGNKSFGEEVPQLYRVFSGCNALQWIVPSLSLLVGHIGQYSSIKGSGWKLLHGNFVVGADRDIWI